MCKSFPLFLYLYPKLLQAHTTISTWFWTEAKWIWAPALMTALWLWWSRSLGWWSTLTRPRLFAEVTSHPFSLFLHDVFHSDVSKALVSRWRRLLAFLQHSLPPEDLRAQWLQTDVGEVWRGLLLWSLSQSQDLPPGPGWCERSGLLEAYHEV